MSAIEQFVSMRGALDPGRRKEYCLAGRAIVTIRSISTGNRFTYKIQTPDGAVTPHFVKVLCGPENSSDYMYIGIVDSRGEFRLTAKSRAGADADADSVRAFAWFSKNWEDRRVEVWHEGVCGRCGRRLTVPESIASGIGPTCAEKGGKHVA